ncbi:MAG: hypothetical protein WD004_05705 [Actinomycetota bacterium]
MFGKKRGGAPGVAEVDTFWGFVIALMATAADYGVRLASEFARERPPPMILAEMRGEGADD